MRVLVGPQTDELAEFYAPPRSPWLRLNFVATVDGAIQGDGGKSGDINNATDKRAFDMLRDSADAIVVGAGTARTEGYRPAPVPTVVVSRSGQVPPLLVAAEPGEVLLVCPARAPGAAEASEALGHQHVITLGEEDVDLPALPGLLHERGLAHLLCEGGPSLARDLLAAGVVDELCATTVPRLIAGDHLRMVHGDGIDVRLELAGLLEEDSTLLYRWILRRDRVGGP